MAVTQSDDYAFSMRPVYAILAVVLAATGLIAATYGVWLVTRGGYEPRAREFVGSLFLAGSACLIVVAVGLGWLALRQAPRD